MHQSIYDLGIHKCSHRGRRAGSHIHRKIIDHRQRNNVVVSNLHSADRPQHVLAKFRTAPHQQCYQLLTFYLCNARSVRNKIAEFTDLVCECKPDLLVLTETWLGCNDCAVRTQICPPGYKFADHGRDNRRGGGTGLLYRDSINAVKGDAAELCSFEYSEWKINSGPQRIRLFIIYRPPYSDAHPVTTFLSEFGVFLESATLCMEPLLIVGDYPASSAEGVSEGTFFSFF